MRIGLALPQYDYSVAGERPLRFETIVDYAAARRAGGAESVWLSDHLFLDLAKYGGSPSSERRASTRSSRWPRSPARVPRVRLGTLVLLEALRPAAVLAKALATVDCVSGGRLDVGLGAGWYEPEYAALGMEMPRPGERLDRLVDALEVVKGLLGGGPFTYDGEYHRAFDATNRPCARAAAAAARLRRRQGRPAAAARGRSTPTAGTRVGCGRPTRTRNAVQRARRRVRERRP